MHVISTKSDLKKAPWRLIPYSEMDGAANMAFDESILEEHIAGQCPPTLRLYGFKPKTVSIGRNQNLEPEVQDRILAAGYDLVRRPTGGRAVLHEDDFTYSFVGNTDFLSTTVAEAYKQICSGLTEAFRLLGVETMLGATNVAYRHLQDCFLATTGSDLHYQGKKLIGSAQLRRKHCVLQHGSLLLNQDQKRMFELLEGRSPQEFEYSRHANLFAITGRTISYAELESAYVAGFSKAFNAQFVSAVSAGKYFQAR